MMPLLLVLLVGMAGLAWVWRSRPDQRRQAMAVVAIAGLGFQLVHVLEHVAQAGAWVVATDQPPFLTPWAVVGRDALAVGGDAALGNELLHLGGNVVFLVGLLAFAWLVRSSRVGRRALYAALVVQGLHVVEHVALTATVATVGTAIGTTTLFGQLDAGPALWSLRVLAHFGLNGVATVAAGVAVVPWARGRTPGRPADGHELRRPSTPALAPSRSR